MLSTTRVAGPQSDYITILYAERHVAAWRGAEVIPSPSETLPADADIVLIGSAEAERRFLELYGKGGAANG